MRNDWRHKLLNWYENNKRDLPWRNINDPYKIWLSEVILQQTRVNQGWQYYLKFIEKYPTVNHLAAASEADVLKLWQGLGYYSRARNLHAAANQVMKEHKGKFPANFNAIRSLRGVGDYTAGAISSIAFHLPHPAVDGNVMRVYSRLLGIETPVDSTQGKKEMMKAANELILHKTPGIYNQAVMELGAILCLPSNPDCENCPVQGSCYAFAHKVTHILPVKENRTKVRERKLNYVVLRWGDKILIRHRKENDIWKGLYDFPEMEQLKSVLKTAKYVIESVSGEYIHILSHQRLRSTFTIIELGKQLKPVPDGCLWINKKDIEKYPVPKLIENFFAARPNL